jgi:SAM-dependent methyltransferase
VSPHPGEADYLARVREHELQRVLPWLATRTQVVEIGGAGGQQARRLVAEGHHVRSFDVQPGRDGIVERYDGVHLPVADGWADAVFSSNTLEHVVQLDALLAECHRVLRPGGVSVHVLPTPTWRLLAILGHGPFGLRELWRGARPQPGGSEVAGATPARSGWRRLLPAAHGEFPSAAHELIEFSAARWRARFERAGFRVDTLRPLGLVYDGYAFLPGLPFGLREALARLIGSACAVYVLSRAVDTPAAKPSRLA